MGPPLTRAALRPDAEVVLRCSGSVADSFVDPLDEIFHIGGVGMTAIVLTPSQMSAQQAVIDGRHLCGMVVLIDAEALDAEQREHGTGRNGRHEASALIEPLRIALFGNAVADEGKARRAQGN